MPNIQEMRVAEFDSPTRYRTKQNAPKSNRGFFYLFKFNELISERDLFKQHERRNTSTLSYIQRSQQFDNKRIANN